MKAVRDGAVFCVVGTMPSTFSSARIDRAKRHRAMPFAFWPLLAMGCSWTPMSSNASRWASGTLLFTSETYCHSSVFFITIAWYGIVRPFRHSPLIDSPRVETVKIASRSCRIFTDSPFRDRTVPLCSFSGKRFSFPQVVLSQLYIRVFQRRALQLQKHGLWLLFPLCVKV